MSLPLSPSNSRPRATSLDSGDFLGDIPTLVDSLSINSPTAPLASAKPAIASFSLSSHANALDLASDANAARKSNADAHSNVNVGNPNDIDVKHGKSSIKKPFFYKTIFALLASLIGLVLCWLIMALPWTKTWVDTHNVPPTLLQAVNYVQSVQGSMPDEPKIRIADQQDPARSVPVNMGALSKDNAQIATFFAKKYRLAATEIEKYIHFAQRAAKAKGLDISLIMAVMSIESNLNPITESPVGAQGLMQVLTAVHLDKLAAYGGPHTVFEPEVNIMVGATILADCIKLGGSLEMGLKCYVGATGPTDNGYGAKVLAEKERIEKAKLGVFDFAPNNKVLIDMGLMAANPEPLQQNNPVPTLLGVNANGRDTITLPSVLPSVVPTGTGVGAGVATATQPLIPATVTALPAPAQTATVLHTTPAHSVSGVVKQERIDTVAPPQTQK